MSTSSTRIVSSSRSSPKKSHVVIDLGSAFIKCGFAGEPRPVDIIPSVIGDAGTGMAAGRTQEQWVEVLTDVFSRMYTESLQCRPRATIWKFMEPNPSSSSRPPSVPTAFLCNMSQARRVVLCESMVCPRALREAVAHVLFRYLQVPALHLCAGPAPALYCTGVDTGIILDIGAREAHVVGVYRGMPLVNSYAAVPLGCRAVQERVREFLFEEEEPEVATEAGGARRPRRQLTNAEVEEVVVRACLVPVGGVPSMDQVSPMEFVFAGKRRVTVSRALRTSAAEQALFEGDDEGSTLATFVLDCLQRCPRDCRRALVRNLLVIGGGALLPGLCARLGQEIRSLVTVTQATETPTDTATLGKPEGYSWARAVIMGETGVGGRRSASDDSAASGGDGAEGRGLCVVRPPTGVARHLLLWTGASIMASLGGVTERSLTSEQYLARVGLPDWMSASPSDWLFSAPPPSNARLTSGVTF